MRDSILTALAVAAALVAHPASAGNQWVRVSGGKLANSGPPFYFAPVEANILVTNLPAGWSAGANQCHTLTLEQAPQTSFRFNDGLTTGNKLVAAGYALDFATARNLRFAGETFITLCRDAAGKPAAFTVQLTYYTNGHNL